MMRIDDMRRVFDPEQRRREHAQWKASLSPVAQVPAAPQAPSQVMPSLQERVRHAQAVTPRDAVLPVLHGVPVVLPDPAKLVPIGFQGEIPGSDPVTFLIYVADRLPDARRYDIVGFRLFTAPGSYQIASLKKGSTQLLAGAPVDASVFSLETGPQPDPPLCAQDASKGPVGEPIRFCSVSWGGADDLRLQVQVYGVPHVLPFLNGYVVAAPRPDLREQDPARSGTYAQP